MPEAPYDPLATFPLLADLDEDDRAVVSSCLQPFTAADGEALATAGQVPAGLHLILQGQVRVTLDGPDGNEGHEVAVLGPNTYFGEMSLLDEGPARATVRAVGEVEGVLLPRSHRDALEATALGDVLRDTARRRHASNRVVDLEPVLVPDNPLGLALRPLWPDDWRLMQASLKRTSQDSLRRRFFSVPNLTEVTLRRLAKVDWIDHFAWAVLEDRGNGPLVGIGRYGRHHDDRDNAELALLVTDDMHGQGIGKILVAALTVAAHRHGVVNFTATSLAENIAVQGLLTRFGAVWQPGDRGQEVATTFAVDDALQQVPTDLRTALQPVVDLTLAED